MLRNYVRNTVQSLYGTQGLPAYEHDDALLRDALAAGFDQLGGLSPSSHDWCTVELDVYEWCNGWLSSQLQWTSCSLAPSAQTNSLAEAHAASYLTPGQTARYFGFFCFTNGEVHVFPISNPGLEWSNWTFEEYCPATTNSTGAAASMHAHGGQVQSRNALFLSTDGLPPQTTAFFVFGSSPTQVPFGNGVRCVASPMVRLPVQQASAAGALAHILSLPDPAAVQLAAGGSWYFQTCYRDVAAGGAGFNSSNAVKVLACP